MVSNKNKKIIRIWLWCAILWL